MSYNQPPAGYQRPGSTTSFAGQGAPPPPYAQNQGFQTTTATPQAQSQCAPPAQNPPPTQQQWGQSPQQGNWGQAPQPPPPQQQSASGYNPGTYGVIGGGYGQGGRTSVPPSAQTNTPYGQYPPPQQHDQPPPPPPKPIGFAQHVMQQQHQQISSPQSWSHQGHGGDTGFQPPQRQNTGFAPQGQQGGHEQQGGYAQQQGGYPIQGAPQQYSNTAPPPPSQTPGGSYFPPSQGGPPSSTYGADQTSTYSTPPSAVATHPPNSILSPNEQQPVYIPPSLTGQGVQSYMPANTNPLPGVYVPPPPDIPAWQQAQHAPLQADGKKYKYTKPFVEPGLQGQAQGVYGQQNVQQEQAGQPQAHQMYGQPQQVQYPPQSAAPQQPPFGQQSPYGQQAPQQSYGQSQQGQFQPPQQTPQYGQPANQQPSSQQHPPQANQWQPNPPGGQSYEQQHQQHPPNAPPPPFAGQQPGQQQGWQPGHQAQGSIQAPRPLNGHTGNTPPNFVTASPQSQCVSPVQNRQSVSYPPSQNNLGRTGSVSSIALDAIRNQGRKTASPAQAKAPTPPPPRDDKSKFSALGVGGPSDWEHFGDGDEIDDEELFGVKKEEADQPAGQGISVELPAEVPPPSPPSTIQSDFPSPPVAPPPLNVAQRRDTYQPSPPPKASQAPQQGFVMGDPGSAPVPTQSPRPLHIQAPPSQQGTPVQRSQQYQPQPQPPPPAGNAFVMGDAGLPAPDQHQQQQPAAGGPFIMGDAAYGAQQIFPQTGAQHAWPQNQNHIAEMKAKDEAYERLRADTDKEKAALATEVEKYKADVQRETAALNVVIERLKSEFEKERAGLHAEIEKSKADGEAARNHAESEKRVLQEQIKTMETTAETAKTNTDAALAEKDATIERLKEDIEGKAAAIQEIDSTFTELKRQLESEKSKEVPKPTPADLIPDIDPWYAGSLERYITMLRSEANEPQVEEKIKTFTAFLTAESRIRGLDYYSAPPPTAALAPSRPTTTEDHDISPLVSRGPSSASTKKQDMHVQMPPPRQTFEPEPEQYSPGGRPILQRRPTLQSNESVATEHTFTGDVTQRPGSGAGYKPFNRGSVSAPSEQSTTILTPTSSTGDEFNKNAVQSPPEQVQQPQYKPYVPSAGPSDSAHRQSISLANATFPGTTAKGKHDEIFFGEPKGSPGKQTPTSNATMLNDVPVPAPLSFSPAPQQAANKDPLEALAELLPHNIKPSQAPHPKLEEVRKQVQAMPSDFSDTEALTKDWEKKAASTRAKHDRERRQRQEESEAHTDQLFNDNEISYADIGAIEDEFKEEERVKKAQEDREEYRGYVEDVFDKVYDGLQDQIKTLMELYVETETLLHHSVSGKAALEDNDNPTIKESVQALKEIADAVELRHAKVVQAVADRDKRYKKTEIQPLYAAGNITKMKSVERHFEGAERQAILRAKSEKAERVAALVRVSEEAVVSAVGKDNVDSEQILTALRAVGTEEEDGKAEVLETARHVLLAIKDSSKELLALFNGLEVDLNTSVFEAEIAQARAEPSPQTPMRITELEKEKAEGEKKLKEEFERRVSVLEQDRKEIEALVEANGAHTESEGGGVVLREQRSGSVVKPVKALTEEEEKKRRLEIALEEAKRRNGHA